ncbi:hypothetical protein H2199_004389 [Coniosporium tulheliwenetii]|uniref:Uncharacterized protein n=1 Tax=Coniosporium tulheliwenetii TaxID=3383036 RepID=A0ACC2Z5D7_9PEZI|nr:hypothetical protein H2199_004389 [Cladosporium sp. JES 115]
MDPPPLLFARERSSTPPSLSQSQLSRFSPRLSPPPMPTEDMDMSMSITLPQGQNHDREDSDMEGTEDADQVTQPNSPHPPADAMDTTSDTLHAQARLEAATIMAELAGTAPVPPPPPVSNTFDFDAPNTHPPVTIIGANLVRVTSNGSTIDSTGEALDDYQPPRPPIDSNEPGPSTYDDGAESDSSSEEEDTGYRWYPLEEDTSSPDEAELKEIESREDYSALDHEYWEAKTFEELEDPEYTPGPTGRIHWKIKYNGTRENQQKELLRKSDIVNVGGYDWQIKFYPRGNDSDYLSIYVECVSVVEKKDKEGEGKQEDARKDSHSDQEPKDVAGEQAQSTSKEPLASTTKPRPPLPLLRNAPPPRRSVAAQVSVVLYSPSEPRVGYFRSCLHRFCPGSPDWGWTRFHGPYFDIHRRQRGQLQALLRNDELAFTAYIRIIEDETGCLGEHQSADNPWDSYAMTGLPSMVNRLVDCKADGNLISVMSIWMLLRPFRELLYKVKAPDMSLPDEARQKPMFLTTELQEVLLRLRCQVDPGDPEVDLCGVLCALLNYGIYDDLAKMDVVQIWEVLRTKLEQEWAGTPMEDSLTKLFGTAKDHRTGLPSYRVPVKGYKTIQDAIDGTKSPLVAPGDSPIVLNIELERQIFDEKSRAWTKLTDELILNDLVSVNGIQYTLFGMVIHKGDLQSGLYRSIIRPHGPGSNWYSFEDKRNENIVMCLTQREVNQAQRISNTADKEKSSAIAYLATYIQSSVLSKQLDQVDLEKWEVPRGLLRNFAWASNISEWEHATKPLDTAQVGESNGAAESEDITHEFEVIDSRAFMSWEGPGYLDLYDNPELTAANKYTLSLPSSIIWKGPEIRDRIAQLVPGIEDPRQIMLWFLNTEEASPLRPYFGPASNAGFLPEDDVIFRKLKFDDADTATIGSFVEIYSDRRFWLHVIPLEYLSAQLVKPLKITPEPEMAADAVPEAGHTSQATDQDDTVMSDLGDFNDATGSLLPIEDELLAEATRLNDAANAAVIAAAQELVAVHPPLVDTEMIDAANTATAPPPAGNRMPEPPTNTPSLGPHMYFFLKVFDGTLRSRGAHIAKLDERVDKAIAKILQLDKPSEQKMGLFQEKSLVNLTSIRRRRTFQEENRTDDEFKDGAIIIVMFPIPDETKEDTFDRGEILDLQTYLQSRSDTRNYPHLLTGTFTFDHFSSDFYSGSMLHRRPHGHGKRIYHNGDVYEGDFRFSERHGHGTLTYRNNDVYVGHFSHDQRHGYGTFTDASTGNVYEGNWKRDRRFGRGLRGGRRRRQTTMFGVVKLFVA